MMRKKNWPWQVMSWERRKTVTILPVCLAHVFVCVSGCQLLILRTFTVHTNYKGVFFHIFPNMFLHFLDYHGVPCGN